MLRVEPWQRFVWMEWGCPLEAAVGLEFHAEKGIGQTGEIIVVDACIDECCWKANLEHVSLLLNCLIQLCELKTADYLPTCLM